jgi:hypothetical protein
LIFGGSNGLETLFLTLSSSSPGGQPKKTFPKNLVSL